MNKNQKRYTVVNKMDITLQGAKENFEKSIKGLPDGDKWTNLIVEQRNDKSLKFSVETPAGRTVAGVITLNGDRTVLLKYTINPTEEPATKYIEAIIETLFAQIFCGK